MAIKIRHKGANLFSQGTEALACPVNCVGVMGAGLAKTFAARFPAMVRPYEEACRTDKIVIGKVYTITVASEVGRDLDIVCVPTKDHWRRDSDLGEVQRAITDLAREADDRKWKDIAIPALGCGLGKLAWGPVKSALESAFVLHDTCAVVIPPR